MSQYYEIRIRGHLDRSWSDWFDQLTITHEDDGDTVLAGSLPDQSALHGVIRKVCDLGITLVSVNPVENTSDEGKGESE